MEAQISEAKYPGTARVLLSWIFPHYVASQKEKVSYYAYARPVNQDIAEDEKRVCSPDYFPIYFRSAVPEDMFSNSELQRLITILNADNGEEDAIFKSFDRVLDSIPPGHPKREDFLWKLSRSVTRLKENSSELLSYAVARRAADYSYDAMNIGEAARALNVVFSVAQYNAQTPIAQRVLTESMKRATDDTFAKRLLEFTQDSSRNRVLTDYSNIDADKVKNAFVHRMRSRYGTERNIEEVNIAQGDWWAFRIWARTSKEDQANEQHFWSLFIDRSRKRLAQAINFVYPANTAWLEDPRPIISELFPVDELARLMEALPEAEELTEVEQSAFARLDDLIAGRYPRPFGE